MHARVTTLFHSPRFLVYDFRCQAAPGTAPASEMDQHAEIGLTRTGRFACRIKGQRHELDSRQVFLTNPHEERLLIHDHEEVHDQCTCFRVDQRLLYEVAAHHYRSGQQASARFCPDHGIWFPRASIATGGLLDLLHHRLWRSLTEGHPPAPLSVEQCLLAFVDTLYARLFEGGNNRDLQEPKHYLPMVERAKAFMLQNLDQELTLSQIAQAAFASPYHFCRQFRRLTGVTPYQYLLTCRLDLAVLLLLETRRTVTAIGFDCGFHHLPHFIDAFRRKMGISPLQFRKLNGQTGRHI